MHPLLNRLLLVSLSLSASVSLSQESAPGAFPIYAATATEELRAKEGQKVLVYGETTGSGKSQSGMNFVNFKDAELYLVTFKSDVAQFPDGEPADAYDGKRITVTGVISIYKDKVQIKLISPDQVKILGEDEAWPQAAAKAEPAADVAEAPKTPAPGKPSEEEPKKKPPVDSKLYFK